MIAFYFGTYEGAGHYLFRAGEWRRLLPPWEARESGALWSAFGIPWAKIDSTLNPSREEGEAALHHKDGWTALAFANYTDDSRPNSNSVFFFDAVLTFDGAMAAAREHFPHVLSRFDFEIRELATQGTDSTTADPQEGT